MIMTDQDHDGSHIKGLLINLFHLFWPSLLKHKGFVVDFSTPIIKASHKNGNVVSFYTMPEYKAWKEGLNVHSASSWTIKYYKGLGTSTAEEGREYFQQLSKHKRTFIWDGEQDGEAIELAFGKNKEERRDWLRQFEAGTTYLDHKEEITYGGFVNKELILYFLADLHRSIPSMVDGLKPGQRKLLFCAFKCNLTDETKVSQFSGYVSEHSAYHHAEQNLANTLVGMAQDFVGSNNINLFQPKGQFGTRNKGGKDAASGRYINTRLSPITRFLFPKDDDPLLIYLEEYGKSVEPAWYMPVIPMVLVNGSEGIGTGWSSKVPNYNPRDVVANVRQLLNAKPMLPMQPWYRGFKGLIEKSEENEAGDTYTTTGIIEEVDDSTVRITELPIGSWTADYFNKFLIKLVEDSNFQVKRGNSDEIIHFEAVFLNGMMAAYQEHLENEGPFASADHHNKKKREWLERNFKLTTTIKTNNMHLFDSEGQIKKYDTPEQILKDFFHLRLRFYAKRKEVLLESHESDILKLANKIKFFIGIAEGEITMVKQTREDLFLQLQQKRFTPIPLKTKDIDAAIEGATIDDYKYLLSMPVETSTREKIQELIEDKQKLVNKLEVLKNTLPEALWMRDLDALESQLDELEQKDLEATRMQQDVRRRFLDDGDINHFYAKVYTRRHHRKPSL